MTPKCIIIPPPLPLLPPPPIPLPWALQLHASQGNLAAAAQTLRGVDRVKGTPAMASALARLYVRMGDRDAAVGVVEEAVQAACRGDHVRASCHHHFTSIRGGGTVG